LLSVHSGTVKELKTKIGLLMVKLLDIYIYAIKYFTHTLTTYKAHKFEFRIQILYYEI